jgi:16S rRNA (uracil1498-N3)-methyltransferase
MTRRRWIADEVSGNRATLTGSHADHLSRVLRARVGQQFDIVVDGILRRGSVAAIADNKVEFELGEEISSSAPVPITLALSIFKFDRMEWAIEKCTELGAARIVPIIARRTEAHLAVAAERRMDRWQRIAKQAAEQSRRISVPEISAPLKVAAVAAISAATRIILDETERDSHLPDTLSSHESGEVALAFGPEGGWTEDELKIFHAVGWKSASLGPTILRTETAAIAAIAVASSCLMA